MDVTVTIANWNQSELLRRCLRSIASTAPGVAVETIVVDNASQDGSVELLRAEFPGVQLIVNAQNVGFGRAQNQAIAHARGRYLLALNNDAEVLPGTIPELVRFMDTHPRAGICTCPAWSESAEGWRTGGGMLRFPAVWREAAAALTEVAAPPFGMAGAGVLQPVLGAIVGSAPAEAEREVAWARGALLMMRREMLAETGGFDQRFFMYFEETDLCRRARAAGWSIWYTPRTAYRHLGRASATSERRREAAWAKSGAAYFRKHHGPVRAALFQAQYLVLRRGLLDARRAAGRGLRMWRG
jgi:GT2 family glycosyltransferase